MTSLIIALLASPLDAEVRSWAQEAQIPGLAWAEIRHGAPSRFAHYGDVDEGTVLDIASVTKSMTAVLLVQSGVDLDARVTSFIPNFEGHRDVTLRHILSHASEGEPGRSYVYSSSRYSLLTRVVEKVTGRPFAEALGASILAPANMEPFGSPNLKAHAGLRSNVRNLARYCAFLNALPADVQRQLVNPTDHLPTSLGFFVTRHRGEPVVWSFGQDDASSSLLIWKPQSRTAFVALARGDRLSNPFRLLIGQLNTSPFAQAFLGVRDTALRLRSLALLATFDENPAAFSLLRRLLEHYRPAVAMDPSTLFMAVVLPNPDLKAAAEPIARSLLAERSADRWVLLHAGELLLQLGKLDEGTRILENVAALPNQSPDFIHQLFQSWVYVPLAEAWRERDPLKAQGYLETLLALPLPPPVRQQAKSRWEKLSALPESWRVTEFDNGVVTVTHQPYAANSLIVPTRSGEFILVDSPFTPYDTRVLLAWTRARFGKMPAAVVTSHYHADGSAGNQVFAKLGIRTISGEKTARLLPTKGPGSIQSTASYVERRDRKLAERVRMIVPTPAEETHCIEGTAKLSVAGEPVWLVYVGPSHSEDSIGIFFPRLKTLYGGCTVRSDGRIINRSEANYPGWKKMLEAFGTLGARVVVPGHGVRFEPEMIGESLKTVIELQTAAVAKP